MQVHAQRVRGACVDSHCGANHKGRCGRNACGALLNNPGAQHTIVRVCGGEMGRHSEGAECGYRVCDIFYYEAVELAYLECKLLTHVAEVGTVECSCRA